MTQDSHTSVSTSTDQHERRLLERVANDDRRAFEQLFYGYHPRLMRFLLRMVRSESTAEELVNDVMLVVWRKADSFAGHSRVSTWIFGIAYRTALKALRRQRVLSIFVNNPARIESARGSDFGFDVEHEWLVKGFDALSPTQRAVVELSFYGGFGYAEIARILECPENTVKTRMFHARKKLKAALPPLAGDDITLSEGQP